MTIIRDDFEVVTAKGAVIRQFDDLKRAQAFARAKEEVFPGVTVLRVTVETTERRQTVYRPRLRLVEDLEVPGIPMRRAG